MRLSAIVLLFSALVAFTLAAPASVEKEDVKSLEEQNAEATTVINVAEDSKEDDAADQSATEVPADETTLSPTRDGRQLNEEDEDEDADDDAEDDDDDDEDEEDEEEEEEEAARNQVVKSSNKKAQKNNKKPAESKPVPVLGEGGLEDDEAEDLGLGFERQEPNSDEKASDEKDSDEEQKDEQEDEDDESAEDEERDEPNGPAGLVADPVSSERGDVDDSPAPPATQNEVEQPLAIAVVEREEEPNVAGPVVPVIVEENNAPVVEQEVAESKPEPSKKNKPKKDKDEDDDDDDEDEEEEEEEEEEEAARSEKVSRSSTGEDILYYYPYPANPVMPEHLVEEQFY